MNFDLHPSALLEKTRPELAGVNREPEETNRGVLALYAELDDRAREIQKAVEHHEKIFEEFYRVRNPPRQKNKGTGIGLAIVRRCIGKINGRIAFASAPGAGTTCTITLRAA